MSLAILSCLGAKEDGRIYPNQPFMSGDLEPGQCGSRTIA